MLPRRAGSDRSIAGFPGGGDSATLDADRARGPWDAWARLASKEHGSRNWLSHRRITEYYGVLAGNGRNERQLTAFDEDE